MSKVIKVLLILVLLATLLYAGSCVYANVKALSANPYKIPAVDDARYSVTVINTSSTYFTSDIENAGGVIVMRGYWYFNGDKYEYNKADSPALDPGYFGEIKVKER
jgi:hypothetical protein